MNNRKKTRKNDAKLIPILSGVFVFVLIVMIMALCMPKNTSNGEFVPPAMESAAVSGIPDVPAELGYTELYQEGMAYRVSVCGVPSVEGQSLTVFFTNTEGNEKYLKLRVVDEQGSILGETGLLQPGEYVECVKLKKTLSSGTAIKLKIMGYEPADYSSAGSVLLNVTIQSHANEL